MELTKELPIAKADMGEQGQCIAFVGHRRIASGPIREVALRTKALLDKGADEPILIFDSATSHPVEIDFRGTPTDVEARLQPQVTTRGDKRGPGRPKLGVVGREVTLLPRHWLWLDEQPGGASVALRKLVEQATRDNREKDRARASQDAAYRFMSAMAGNLPNFEEASRAFFAGKQEQFLKLIKPWPKKIRDHARHLAATAFHDRDARW
jgi:hypothetical protein